MHKAQTGLEAVSAKNLLPNELIVEAQQELLEIREAILQLMDDFRGHSPKTGTITSREWNYSYARCQDRRSRVTHGQRVTTSIKEVARPLQYVLAAAKTTLESGHGATHFKEKRNGNL